MTYAVVLVLLAPAPFLPNPHPILGKWEIALAVTNAKPPFTSDPFTFVREFRRDGGVYWVPAKVPVVRKGTWRYTNGELVINDGWIVDEKMPEVYRLRGGPPLWSGTVTVHCGGRDDTVPVTEKWRRVK